MRSDSFAALDRGEGIEFASMDDLAAFIDETGGGFAIDHRPAVAPVQVARDAALA